MRGRILLILWAFAAPSGGHSCSAATTLRDAIHATSISQVMPITKYTDDRIERAFGLAAFRGSRQWVDACGSSKTDHDVGSDLLPEGVAPSNIQCEEMRPSDFVEKISGETFRDGERPVTRRETARDSEIVRRVTALNSCRGMVIHQRPSCQGRAARDST